MVVTVLSDLVLFAAGILAEVSIFLQYKPSRNGKLAERRAGLKERYSPSRIWHIRIAFPQAKSRRLICRMRLSGMAPFECGYAIATSSFRKGRSR